MVGVERGALGWSVHTGWAACVVASGSLRAPRIAARVEVELMGDPQRFVFHRAAEGPRADAAAAIARARDAIEETARREVARILREARAAALGVGACAIVAKTGAMPSPLDAVLDAHPRIHAAEGCLYRDAIAEAATRAGLAVVIVPPRELAARAAKTFGASEAAVREALDAAGRVVGKPWAKDQKEAALAAWLAAARE